MPDSYLQRAELLADLGRYEEAVEELERAVSDAPDHAPTQTLLARVRLATGALPAALQAADAAVAAAPTDVAANIARGMVLADLGQIDEAAAQAEQILRHGRGDGYACTSAAAILAQVRTGQVALDAAWEGVRLNPDQPRAHLVLGVVAARLGLDDIAERAYGEALRLDPQLETTEPVLGLVRQEQHRYAQALSRFQTRRRAPSVTGAPTPAAGGLSPPVDPVQRLLDFGALSAVVSVTVVTCVAGVASPTTARGWAALLAVAGLAGLTLAYRRLPADVRSRLPHRARTNRAFAVAAGLVVAAPAGLLVGAVTGSTWALLAASAAALVALFANRLARS